MPTYEHDKDLPESVAARAAQDDPSVMYLIVRKAHAASLEELLVASAAATCEVVARYAGDPRYADEFAYWASRSFRKVCLRANEKEWPKVLCLDAGDGAARGEVVVRALPPRRKSARERLLVGLQAYSPGVGELPSRPVALDDEAPTMALAVNADVVMSAGKLAAQVGHAVLLGAQAFGARDADAVARWASAGHRCVVLRASGAQWAALQRDERCAVVRDAGITEVAHGSETVLALAPGPPRAWSGLVRSLDRV